MWITIYVLLTLLVLFFLWKIFFTNEIVSVKSTIDNRDYIIRNGNKTQKYLQESANALAIINQRIEILIKHLSNKYNVQNPRNFFILKLIQNYDYKLLSEAAYDTRFTTFTIDKQDMHVCLRTRDNHEKLYDINVLMYVVLHELAHLCNYDQNGNPITGHGKEFKYIFKMLVTEAIQIGIYDYVNFSEKPTEYCGIVINSTIV
jgi:hypothetical protein